MRFLARLPIALIPALLAASDCSRTSTGMKPLNAPFFGANKGSPAGLYPNLSSQRPAAHEAGGRAQAAQVRPRDTEGNPDDRTGRIVLLSIGLSNTTQEFSAFKQIADRDPQKNPRVALVDGAQGGWSADRIVASPDDYWNGVEQRIRAAGASDAQVQAAWLKLADANPTLPFPDDAKRLQSEIQQVVRMAKSRYPNLRLVYLSSRIYAGYATSNLNPEPFAYESAFSVKWLIEAQINGDVALDYAGGGMPWLAWGPYLWADGMTPRVDGLVWNCSDFEVADGTHPSRDGQIKVAGMLSDFFKNDTTTRPWFVANTAPPPRAPTATAAVNGASFAGPIAPGGIATIKGADLAGTSAAASGLPLSYGLAGTSVAMGGEPAPLYYVSPTQINVVVPATAKDATVVVAREGVSSAAFGATMALYTEGLFTIGGGAAAALHANGELIGPANPARRGETIELFGTGKGLRNPAILAPELLPIVRVGGMMAQIRYFGPAPVYPGLDQINIVIPPDAPAGADIPLTVELGSFAGNSVLLAVAGN